MSGKALKVVVEIKLRAVFSVTSNQASAPVDSQRNLTLYQAGCDEHMGESMGSPSEVSCPGVHLPAKDDIYLILCFMGQYRHSESLPAVFPLLFHEKMTFEKIFRHAVDPGDIAVMLEYESVRAELVQLIPPAGHTLASFEEDARSFLFPEPKLVRPFSGVDREVLMMRASPFPGIAPRLEFSTKTTIIECSPDAEVNIYPNKPMRPVRKRSRRRSSRPRTSSPQKRHPPSYGHRSRSLSPDLARLSLDSAAPPPAGISQPMPASWPGADRPARFPSPSSPFTRSSCSVRPSPAAASGLVEAGSSSSETHQSSDSPGPSELGRSYREHARPSRSESRSHRAWEEVHERVRGLLTTPKAVRRLVYGATTSEVEEVLWRRSISPGPP